MVGKSDFSAAPWGGGEEETEKIYIHLHCTAVYCTVFMSHTHLAFAWSLPARTQLCFVATKAGSAGVGLQVSTEAAPSHFRIITM